MKRSEVAAIRIRLWLQCRWENGPAASEPCPQKRMTASWSGPYMGSTEYKRGSRAIARGQWQAPLGSARGERRHLGQPCGTRAVAAWAYWPARSAEWHGFHRAGSTDRCVTRRAQEARAHGGRHRILQ